MNIDNNFTFQIISNQDKIFREHVYSITFQTSEGQISVLKQHTKLVTNILMGNLVLTYENQAKENFFTYKGIAIINNFELIIITDFFVELNVKDQLKINKLLTDLKELQKHQQDQSDINTLEKEISKYEQISSYLENK